MAIRYKRCIRCGSTNTAEILYGMPTSDVLPLVEANKIRLGGCCMEFETKTFTLIDASQNVIGEYTSDFYLREYYCHTCEAEWNKEQAIYHAYSQIEKIKISITSFTGGFNHQIEIDFLNRVIYYKQGYDEEFVRRKIEANELVDLIEQLKDIRLLHWKANYSDPTILDGIQWGIEIKYPKRTRKKYGSNQYPKEWKEFTSLLEELTTIQFS